MGAIDADAHVVECPATFDYIDDEFSQHRPRIVTDTSDESKLSPNNAGGVQRQYWMLDGRLQQKDFNAGQEMSRENREMEDIGARLKHMDALDVDLQVLYPTLFLRPWTQDAEVEYAICKSYNRWLAEIWKQARGRLRWVVMAPLMTMDKTIEELEFAKANGACGIFMRGIECERRLSNPYFFRLYEVASMLDLPICCHAGNGSFAIWSVYGDETGIGRNKCSVIAAFHSLLREDIPAKFPALRWGFIEVSAMWVPYVLNDFMLRLRRKGIEMSDTMLADNNFFVACQSTDDLDYILPYAGEGQLVVGTDYGHADNSSDIEAMRKLREDGKLPPEVVDRILSDNARVLYGL
ncbi:MAG: amidohydrolase family protein [Alphaproteobacteria bacterium]